MSQNKRILLVVLVIIVLAGAVIGIEQLRGQRLANQLDIALQPGDIPVYWNGTIKAGFSPTDIEKLPQASFIDAEEGKTQDGWLLKDVLLLYFKENQFKDGTHITVSSSSRNKAVELTWAEVANPDNMVMFDLSGRGTLKLVSLLEKLDTRDEWIQDTDRIEINTK